LKDGFIKESLDLADDQTQIEQEIADFEWASLIQGVSAIIKKTTKASILLTALLIFCNDYVIDHCVDFDKENTVENWVCSHVADQTLSVS
jgi:hypothetical protein